MSVRRVMGIETEYGVWAPGHPELDPVTLSSQVVATYSPAGPERTAGPGRTRPRWDYEDEAPLRDARGYEVARSAAHASQLTDGPRAAGGSSRAEGDGAAIGGDDPLTANVVLTNGARLYVDHAHPEYSSPEVTGPLAAVRWDRAGEVVVARAAAQVAAAPGLQPVNLYKNNTDGKGASYGTHENYLMDRATPFGAIVRGLVPFFVSRQVVCGAGRVGLGQRGEEPGFQLSQRADYFETEVGLETTLKRPIINTRDEPHATADRYRRLHVIVGDANLCDVATYLKLGTTALVLDMVEAGTAPDLVVAAPVAELHAVSHDPSLRHRVRMADGSEMTALDVQHAYLEAARAHVGSRGGGPDDAARAETADVLARWEQVLTDLAADPFRLAGQLDWVAKLRLLQGFRDREQLAWDAPRLHLIDLQYADVNPAKGLHMRLRARGAVEQLVDDDAARSAATDPPEDTRAWFRGECLRRYGRDVAAASWDSVIFDVPGRGALQRVPMLEPTRGTRAGTQALLDRCPDAAALVDALSGR